MKLIYIESHISSIRSRLFFKKQFNQDGMYTEEKEVKLIDGKYVAVPIVNPQLSFEDMQE